MDNNIATLVFLWDITARNGDGCSFSIFSLWQMYWHLSPLQELPQATQVIFAFVGACTHPHLSASTKAPFICVFDTLPCLSPFQNKRKTCHGHLWPRLAHIHSPPGSRTHAWTISFPALRSIWLKGKKKAKSPMFIKEKTSREDQEKNRLFEWLL